MSAVIDNYRHFVTRLRKMSIDWASSSGPAFLETKKGTGKNGKRFPCLVLARYLRGACSVLEEGDRGRTGTGAP